MRVFAIGIEDPLDATVQRAQDLDRRMHHEVSAACSKDSATTTAPMQPVALSRHHPRAASEQRTVCYHFATRLSHQFRTNTEALCCARVAPTRRDHTGKPVARSERFELPTLGIEILGAISDINGLAVWCCCGAVALLSQQFYLNIFSGLVIGINVVEEVAVGIEGH